MTQRLCRICRDWHDLNEPWPSACHGHFARYAGSSGIQVIKDIDPYKSTIDGSVIGSRGQHRDHLRAHGCIEVGNEWKPHIPDWDVPGRVDAIKQAMETSRVR